MLPSLSSVASSASDLIPSSIVDKADSITTVAKEVFRHFVKSEESSAAPVAAIGGAGTGLVEFGSQAAPSFYKELKKKAYTPYETSNIRPSLRAKPWLSQRILIDSYLDILSDTRITHQIYQKIEKKWGYDAFFRISKPGSEGLAIAFISHVLLEDATKSPSIIFGKLIRFYTSIITENKIPSITENLKLAVDALSSGSPILNNLLSSEEDSRIQALVQGLTSSYYEKYHFSSDLSLAVFIESLPVKEKTQAKKTLASFEGFSLIPLIPLLGPTHSIFRVNPLRKFALIMTLILPVLEQVKSRLSITTTDTSITGQIRILTPTQLLTCFEANPLTKLHKKALMDLFLNFFKEELVRALEPNSSVLLEGFSFAERADHRASLDEIAEEICRLDGTYLEKLLSMDSGHLFQLATVLEHYEEALSQRQIQFIEYLSKQFDVSFIVHRWQLDKEKNNHLKMHLIGSWDKPTCHLTLFPENNLTRVDLISFKGLYTSREKMGKLIRSHKLMSFKKRSSKTLCTLSKEDSSISPLDKDYIKHILYFRLHVFASIQKLTHLKIPQLQKDPYDLYGSKEEDLEELMEADSGSQTEMERKAFKLEKHLINLIREIGELRYISEGIFSRSQHKDLLNEIKILLKSAKKIIVQFYLTQLPFFIAGLGSATARLNQEINAKYETLKGLKEAYSTLNPTNTALFTDLFSKTTSAHLTSTALVSLIPSLYFEKKPPKVFSEIHQLQDALDTYFKAQNYDQTALQGEINTLFLAIKEHRTLFSGFYSTQSAAFCSIFDKTTISTKELSTLKTLIPQTGTAHPELKSLFFSMTTLHEKLKKQQELETILSEANRTTIQTLVNTIKTQKTDFMTFNPTKETIFDRVVNVTAVVDITRDDLTALRLVSIENETAPVYLALKSLYETLKTLESFKANQTYFLSMHAAFESRGSIEDDGKDSDDEGSRDDASVGSFRDGAGSIASYGSNTSIGSTEKFLAGLL